ncbi:MAG: amidohydrolase family protein [Candidatus Nanopelagicaceae bacterium]|nr:amidohydrolase family protein [Candidatus Nanopelagicaceae bacterium]
MIISAATVLIDQELQKEVWLEVEDGLIRSINSGSTPEYDYRYDGILIPGFVDIHCHGGGGKYFSSLTDAEISQVIATHRAGGTVAGLASLVTEPIPNLLEQIKRLVPFAQRGEIAGIHLEGPYLSHARCGAHDPTLLRTPTIVEVQTLLDAGQGFIKMITIAPELDGALEVIEYLSKCGVIAAIGHSQSDANTAEAAIDRGASVVTHFNNAMPKVVDGPGTMSSAVISDLRVSLELILDGEHVSTAIVRDVFTAAPNRIVMVTDAMSAAGSVDGNYRIAELEVIVKESVARLASNGSLAGSTLTMAKAFNHALNEIGISITEAVHAASTLPALILGRSDLGEIAVGKSAQLNHLTKAGLIEPIKC